MNTDNVARKREEEKEEKAKDPMTRRETIKLMKRDSKDTHVLGKTICRGSILTEKYPIRGFGTKNLSNKETKINTNRQN